MSLGYTVPNYESIRATVVEKWKAKHGANADTSSDTVDGLIIDILSEQLRIVHEGVANASGANFLTTAEGTNVDALIAPLFGIARRQQTKTYANAYIYGSFGDTVDAGAIASTFDTSSPFELLYDCTIAATNVFVMVVGIQPTSQSCTVTINGVSITRTLPLGDAFTAGNYLAGQVNAMTGVIDARVYGADPNLRAIIVVRMLSPYSWSVSTSGVLTSHFANQAAFQATEYGPVKCDTGTLVRPSGFTGVVNIVPGSLGRFTDNDAAYKATHGARIFQRSKTTPRGLEEQILAIDGVTSCTVYMNTGLDMDGSSRPGKSFEAVVEGGPTEDIATCIWLNHPVGIESHGSTAVNITDSRGYAPVTRQVYFSRPTYSYAWFRIDIGRGQTFPIQSLTDVAIAVAQAIEDFGTANVKIGSYVYASRIAALVHENVPGVSSCTVEVATTASPIGAPPSYPLTNIEPSDTTRVVLGAGRVSVSFS